jgi:hypothetical protein
MGMQIKLMYRKMQLDRSVGTRLDQAVPTSQSVLFQLGPANARMWRDTVMPIKIWVCKIFLVVWIMLSLEWVLHVGSTDFKSSDHDPLKLKSLSVPNGTTQSRESMIFVWNSARNQV